jgi:hypothetical protein
VVIFERVTFRPRQVTIHVLNRWIRWYLHLAVFTKGREAQGREWRHVARALLGGGGS